MQQAETHLHISAITISMTSEFLKFTGPILEINMIISDNVIIGKKINQMFLPATVLICKNGI